MKFSRGTFRTGSLLVVMAAGAAGQSSIQGQLQARSAKGAALPDCPLKHTTVKADITGPFARVNVVQEFENPLTETIEAVYVFPLPHDSAVDGMTMKIGSRVIQGKIHRREEARELYDRAKAAGKVASLVDQERPNIFTQSVANVTPGAKVEVTISYLQIVTFDEGTYEFRFPMVVGPRYTPSTQPPADRARITPPVAPNGTRAGHDISIEVVLDAGLPILNPVSKSHDVDVVMRSATAAAVKLRDEQTIPNQDFVLRYTVPGRKVQDALLTHHTATAGYFALILQPPEHAAAADVSPKELVFVLDTSGSMFGFPIEKAKEAMRLALDGLYSNDTFNLITFSGDTEILFPAPVAATDTNRSIAKLFLNSRSGAGGTEMMKAIRAAFEPPVENGRVRIVCFMTDGFVGNDAEILAEIQKHSEARVFAFGIGSSVNHFLLDGMARYGHGEVEYVGLQDDGDAAARRFHQRVRSPLMTDLKIDWGGLPVTDLSPAQIPDLFSAKPVVVTGRFTGPAHGVARLRGRTGGIAMERTIQVVLPPSGPQHDTLATLWARNRIADLMSQDIAGVHNGQVRGGLRDTITELGLNFQLVTPFTSFVAVEEIPVTSGGRTRRVAVPVNLPDGASHQGVYGSGGGAFNGYIRIGGNVQQGQQGGAQGVVGGVPGGVAGGAPGGVIGGVIGSVPTAAPPPPYPPPHAMPVRALTAPVTPEAPPKLDPKLVPVMNGADKSKMVQMSIMLRDASAATLQQLKQLGFEQLKPVGKDLVVTGRIAAGKLAELSQIAAVRYIVAAATAQ